jgi:AraC family transcriptional regulator of adaptative response/methylated-DNA-[protein]-cysteine methyltransferase
MEAAQSSGFRPCKRCRPDQSSTAEMTQMLCAHIEANRDRAVSLSELGALLGKSPFAVQKIFKQHMGVSPLGYQRALKAQMLRQRLKEGESVTNAIYESGFGSSSRGYEGAALGMTPLRFAQGGRGERISFTAAQTGFGWLIVGATERGLCWLALGANEEEARMTLRAEFPAAELHRDASLASLLEVALLVVTGQKKLQESTVLHLDLRGTAFQLRVWQALQRIPRGTTVSYSQLAADLGNPKATRAVARACATNRVALVVPCHRVVGASGSLTGYRWGVERKQQLLKAEREG